MENDNDTDLAAMEAGHATTSPLLLSEHSDGNHGHGHGGAAVDVGPGLAWLWGVEGNRGAALRHGVLVAVCAVVVLLVTFWDTKQPPTGGIHSMNMLSFPAAVGGGLHAVAKGPCGGGWRWRPGLG